MKVVFYFFYNFKTLFIILKIILFEIFCNVYKKINNLYVARLLLVSFYCLRITLKKI